MHHGHEQQHRQQVHRQQANAHMVGQQAEGRGHQAGAGIGAGHLHADHGLGAFRPKVRRGAMDDGGVDGRAAQADDGQAHAGRRSPQGQRQRQHAHQGNAFAQADHLLVIELQGEEAADEPPRGDAQVKQAGKAGGGLLGDAPVQHQIVYQDISFEQTGDDSAYDRNRAAYRCFEKTGCRNVGRRKSCPCESVCLGRGGCYGPWVCDLQARDTGDGIREGVGFP